MLIPHANLVRLLYQENWTYRSKYNTSLMFNKTPKGTNPKIH
jgi:hypothetical protein